MSSKILELLINEASGKKTSQIDLETLREIRYLRANMLAEALDKRSRLSKES